MTEVWRDIPGYEGRYQVSDLGRVKSLAFCQRCVFKNGREGQRRTKERILATQVQNSGYTLVHLHLDNQRKACSVHRLVAAAFVTGCGDEVNHIDGDKGNNRAPNLEWVTSSENKEHAVATGLCSFAVAVVSPLGVTYPSIAKAAKHCRVSPKTIRAGLRGTGGEAGWEFA
jgi:hypothetical protein